MMDDNDLYRQWLATRRQAPGTVDTARDVMERIARSPAPMWTWRARLAALLEDPSRRWPAWAMGACLAGLGAYRVAGVTMHLLVP